MGSERSLPELRSLAALCEGFGGSPTLDNARKVLEAESRLEAMSLSLRELQVYPPMLTQLCLPICSPFLTVLDRSLPLVI